MCDTQVSFFFFFFSYEAQDTHTEKLYCLNVSGCSKWIFIRLLLFLKTGSRPGQQVFGVDGVSSNAIYLLISTLFVTDVSNTYYFSPVIPVPAATSIVIKKNS